MGSVVLKELVPLMKLFPPETKTNGQFSHLTGENLTQTSFMASVIQDD